MKGVLENGVLRRYGVGDLADIGGGGWCVMGRMIVPDDFYLYNLRKFYILIVKSMYIHEKNIHT